MMIFCYFLDRLVPNLLFMAFIRKNHVWTKKMEKITENREKKGQIQSLGTKV